jgi:hypothetical protein
MKGEVGVYALGALNAVAELRDATAPRGQLSGTAAPEALAGDCATQQERAYNEAGGWWGSQWPTSGALKIT